MHVLCEWAILGMRTCPYGRERHGGRVLISHGFHWHGARVHCHRTCLHCHCHGTCSHRNRRRTRHNRHNRLWLRLRCLHLHLERLTRHHASGHREHEQLSWVQNVGIDDQKEGKTKGQKEEGKGASLPLSRQCHCKMPYPRELGDNVSSRVCAVSVRRLERIFLGPKFRAQRRSKVLDLDLAARHGAHLGKACGQCLGPHAHR